MRVLMFSCFFVLLLFCSFAALPVRASEDFTNDYKVDYFLNDNSSTLATHVRFTITLTNLRSEVYVRKISLSFPKSFVVKNIRATDDKGHVQPLITDIDKKTNVELEFNDPLVGKKSVNKFYLEFDQDNLFQVSGNIWEVILPTMEDKTRSSYQITVHLPTDSRKKLTIAKPQPDETTTNIIRWNNPQTKTVYAVFGDSQFYQSKIIYHLQNPKILPVYTEIAFPPDTLYQKVYIDHVSPQPYLTYIDDDGNLMGRYYLKPRQNLDVTYDGTIEVFSAPRKTVQPFIQEQFVKQKQYLLDKNKYWELAPNQHFDNLKSAEDIYEYLTSKFTYAYSRIKTDTRRLGAAEALNQPDQAVCTEFTDAFVAMSREKGIYSRQIEGYGFSQDQQLRPLSLSSDILHAWPEYYDTQTNIWKQVDPTWQNTSGIDYFSSFDLNHITFAIHGKRSDYPVPAGAYKLTDTKDLSILPSSAKPTEEQKLEIESFELPKRIVDIKSYKTILTIKNNSNVYLYNIPISLSGQNLNITPAAFSISALPPGGIKQVEITYQSKEKNKKLDGEIVVSLMHNTVFSGKIIIVPYYYEWGLIVAYIIIGCAVVFGLFRFGAKLRHNH